MSQSAAAILLLLLCNALYTLGYAIARLLADSLDPLEITFLRSALVLAAAMGLSLRVRDPGAAWARALAPPRAWDQRLAALVLILSTTLGVWGYALVPVTEASTLGFTAPIILVALGAIVLRERVEARRWIAVAIGFAGMLLVVRPGTAFGWEAAVPVASALTYALYQVLTRRLRGAADERDAMVQGAIMGVLLLGPPMLILWRTPDAGSAALVVLYTLVQTAALAALAGAVRRAEVSALAPWHYARIVFALALDAALFGRLPDAVAIAGAALIAAGGLILAARARRA
ncbi:MAG TPA: EamA family transporter [Acetobacteraceae bacterium]|nr:EamA family transporter [Acetobacteraceae bacterium]